jgi:hypothetical protein
MKRKSVPFVSLTFFRRKIGSGNVFFSIFDPDDDDVDGRTPNSKSPTSPDSCKFSFPQEKSRANRAVAAVGASRCTRNRPDDFSAFNVSDGLRTLNATTGSGKRVTVLKDDTVMPRKTGLSF